MTVFYTVRPISTDDGLGSKRTASAFKVTWTQTLTLLEREVDMLNGKNLVIELDVLPGQLTNAGQLRATSKVRGNAVRVIFDSKHGQLTYGTNEFVRGATSYWRDGDRHQTMQHDWQHNVYAIARSLEALRQVDRYGVSKRGEQYTGYAALPAGTGGIALGGMTTDEARGAILNASSWAGRDDWAGWDDPHATAKLLRSARFSSHPDRHGGDQSAWDRVEQAARVLGLTS